MQNLISKAIKICGTRTALANKCGVSHQAVGKWVRGETKNITVETASKIEQATNGQVTVADFVASVSE
ncbi:Cro/CI family transcriptional regulator [Pasteurella skyensis]|uniref:Cro/CI family transcriptional regulator n=1 Tax=Phocoenobacter skyensis TaxID=97481 RepID=A0AAJ6NAD6_9PAST|nr:Cro/CI family transcriptional regulator [Pasteurella skyensis]MDP8173153.1 Cro/CI family transcriptional regulator [Pasteurella skyensis]MDP8178914.1 Cro/CI family transcriptional regulator [Pasteurella skyensis]